MNTYFLRLDYTQTDGPLDVLIQYINAQEFEMFLQDATVETLMNGITIEVNTPLINVKIVNRSKCCENEQTINVTKFLVS